MNPRSSIFSFGIALFLGGILTACGSHEQQYAPRAVSVWSGSSQLQANKKAIVAACTKRNQSQDKVAWIVAMAMAETNDCDASQRDTSKDGQGESKNWSLFNMNSGFLKALGWQEGQGPDLNDQGQVDAAVGWIIAGFDKWGIEGTLNFHRGGSSGFCDGVSYGCREYRDAIGQVQQKLMANPVLLVGPERLGMDIPHV